MTTDWNVTVRVCVSVRERERERRGETNKRERERERARERESAFTPTKEHIKVFLPSHTCTCKHTFACFRVTDDVSSLFFSSLYI